MRLINADALKKTLGEWIRNYWTDAFTGDDAGSEFADMIDHAKTIDSAPVVHAHWIVDDKEMSRIWNCHCSYCGKDPQYFIGGSELWWIEILPKYCPQCGAKMDEEGNKNEA